MSATLHPNYFSKSAEANKYTMCVCRKRTLKSDIRMINHIMTCPKCRETK